METIRLYQIDGGSTYWEGYSDWDKNYLVSLEDDEVGDFISKNEDKDIFVYPQESYNAMFNFHIEMDKWWGDSENHLEDCSALLNPRLPLNAVCEGCKFFESWASERVYGDYNKKMKKV